MTVNGTFSLNRAHFSGPATFTSSVIHQLFTLDGAAFQHPSSVPQFNLISVDSIVRMVGTRFAAGVNLTGAHLSDDLNAAGLISEGPARLYRMFIGQTSDLSRARFNHTLDLSYSKIGQSLNLNGAEFGSKELVNLLHVEVGGDLGLSNARVAGPIALNAAVVKGDAKFEGLQAPNQTRNDMTDLSVDRDFILERARFAGDLDMQSAQIRGALIADNVHFIGADSTVNFDSVAVRGIANISEAEFAGNVTLAGFTSGDRLDLSMATFNATNKEIDCSFMKIGSLTIENAVFRGGAVFQQIEVAMDVEASESKFLGDKQASFIQMRIKGDMTFDGAQFAIPPTFTNTVIEGYASFTGMLVKAGNGDIEFSLNAMSTGRFVNLDDVVIDGRVNLVKIVAGTDILVRHASMGRNSVGLSRAVAKGNCIIDGLQSGGIDLTDGSFYNLNITRTRFLHQADDLVLNRLHQRCSESKWRQFDTSARLRDPPAVLALDSGTALRSHWHHAGEGPSGQLQPARQILRLRAVDDDGCVDRYAIRRGVCLAGRVATARSESDAAGPRMSGDSVSL
jgi:hypothetical protein